ALSPAPLAQFPARAICVRAAADPACLARRSTCATRTCVRVSPTHAGKGDPAMPRIDGTLATPLADRRRGHEMIRLMVVCNTVDSLDRPLHLALDEGYAIEFGHAAARGDRVVMLALLVNALKEAVDAFEQVIDLAEELFAYTRGEEIYLKFQTL